MKTCNICRLEKQFEEFYSNKRSSDGLRHTCKTCEIERAKKWQNENKDRRDEINKEFREKNKEYFKNYYQNLTPEKKEENYKKYYKKDDPKEKERRKKYKESYRYRYNKLRVERMKENPILKLKQNFRNFIHNSFRKKGLEKKVRSQSILGCSFEDFKKYLESKFEPWMTWENYGLYNGELNYGWDIDHITPISSAINEEDIIKLNNYQNLQPLCSFTNRHLKSNKIDYIQI